METSVGTFTAALLVGLSIAAPVGPIGLLVIQRSLQRGAAAGLATGLGAALADATYGAVGAFGVLWLVQALQALRLPLALGGGAFLLWLAWRTWRTPPASRAAQAVGGPGLLAAFASTFVLTLSNPATVFSFLAVFSTLAPRGAHASPWLMAAGVGLGSALWWLLLSGVVARLRLRFDARAQVWVNRLAAALLAAFALWQAWAAWAAQAAQAAEGAGS